jgi:three-Cys-motif partner protein
MSHTKGFFTKQSAHSRLKSEIVADYVVPWASIVWPHVKRRGKKRLLYLDFFSGPGRFDDGAESTPLLVLNKTDAILRDGTPLKEVLATRFYEGDPAFCRQLRSNIYSQAHVVDLEYKPKIRPFQLSADRINRIVSRITDGTLVFIDPFDNTRLSAKLFYFATKSWGCDCISYLSVSGITRNVQREPMPEYLTELFGVDGLGELKRSLNGCADAEDADELVMQYLRESLRRHSRLYLVWLFMETDKVERTSYALVFMSKDKLGFKIMRDIMSSRKVSRRDSDDMPVFRFGEKTRILHEARKSQLCLDLEGPGQRMKGLMEDIMRDFRGKTCRFDKVIEICLENGYIYTDANIRRAVELMIESERALLPYSDGNRESQRKFARHDMITFQS